MIWPVLWMHLQVLGIAIGFMYLLVFSRNVAYRLVQLWRQTAEARFRSVESLQESKPAVGVDMYGRTKPSRNVTEDYLHSAC